MRWALCSWSGTGTDRDPRRPELSSPHGAWGSFNLRRSLNRNVCLYVEPSRCEGWSGAHRVELAEAVDEPLGPAVRAAVEARLGIPCPAGSTITSLMEDVALGEILPDPSGRLRMVVGGQVVFDRPVISGGATDDFNRADGGLGSNWTAARGNMPNIVSQAAEHNGLGQNPAFANWNADTFSPDQMARCQVYINRTGQARTGPAVRVQGSGSLETSRCYFAALSAARGVVELGAHQSGIEPPSATPVWILAQGGTVSTSIPFNYNVKVEAIGSTLNAYLDGTPVISTSDTSITAGQPGIYLGWAMGTADQVDDWEGGEAPSSNLFRPPVSQFIRR